MVRTYLSNNFFYYNVAALLLSTWIGLYLFSLLILAFIVGVGYLFRKRNAPMQTKRTDYGVLKSPISGKVISVRSGIDHAEFGSNLSEIKLILHHGSEIGVYLPCAATFEKVAKLNDKEILRFQKSITLDQSASSYGGTIVSLLDEKNSKFGLQFIKCFMGMEPRFNVLAADKGVAGARFGSFPLGGTVLVYLGEEFNVIVKENDRIFAGSTPIASKSEGTT